MDGKEIAQDGLVRVYCELKSLTTQRLTEVTTPSMEEAAASESASA